MNIMKSNMKLLEKYNKRWILNNLLLLLLRIRRNSKRIKKKYIIWLCRGNNSNSYKLIMKNLFKRRIMILLFKVKLLAHFNPRRKILNLVMRHQLKWKHKNSNNNNIKIEINFNKVKNIENEKIV